jgi:hypothetical protein
MATENKLKEIAVVYLGSAEKRLEIGAVTGMDYVFLKNEFGMPLPTFIDERDLAALLDKRDKGCATHDGPRLYCSDLEWKIALEEGTAINRL